MPAFVQMSAIGTPRWARSGPGVTPQLYEEMSLLRNSLLENMREEAPVNKNPNAKNRGALRRSIKAAPWETDGITWRVSFSAAEYVKYVIKDTKPHTIRPRVEGGVLVFEWNGARGLSASLPAVSHISSGGLPLTLGRLGGPSIFQAPAGHAELRGDTVFLSVVHHPGTKANNFVGRAFERTFIAGMPGFTKRVQQAIANDIIDFTLGRVA